MMKASQICWSAKIKSVINCQTRKQIFCKIFFFSTPPRSFLNCWRNFEINSAPLPVGQTLPLQNTLSLGERMFFQLLPLNFWEGIIKFDAAISKDSADFLYKF